ncbi:MAG TPA: hypothetical protein VGI82_08130 [Chitinophagaceae bacterium]|jgi:hypothetical protein
MNKLALVLFSVLIALACNRKPFVNHKLKFERISGNCQNLQPYFRVVSNIAGERYEFQKCLDVGFSKDMMKVSRQGDTVLVQFAKSVQQTALFKITLDIDSYPRYSFLTVDGDTFIITSSRD